MAIVETRYGKVEGATTNGVHSFKGIPFAAPPVGEKRWSAPEPPKPWAGVRAANDDWGKQAWQVVTKNANSPLSFIFNARNATYRDEDCLQLNVWTQGFDGSNRPVVVWIHGGGFSGGTGGTPVYDGTSLAARGNLVVVTINYRLGALGFLRLNDVTEGRIPSTGNEGLLDQTEALKWVRENISAFGGDPGNVTIFGESAGGASVAGHLTFKPSQGLFHRAMPISGAMGNAGTLADANATAESFLDRLKLSGKKDVDKLRELDPEELLNVATGYHWHGTFRPLIDGEHLTELPLEAAQRGAIQDIPVLIGTQKDEWRLFTHAQRSASSATSSELPELDEAGLLEEVSANVPDAKTIIDGYRQILESRGVPNDPLSVLAAIDTGRRMRMPSIYLAEALAKARQPVFQYVFTWESPWNGGILRAPHAIIIGFLFGTYAYTEKSAQFFGHGTAADTLSLHVQDAMINFARTGNPSTEAFADWAPYEDQKRSTGVFNIPAEVANAPFDEERVLWNSIR